jgi:hypothetical protein
MPVVKRPTGTTKYKATWWLNVCSHGVDIAATPPSGNRTVNMGRTVQSMAHKMLATLLNCRNRSFHPVVVVGEEDTSVAAARSADNMESVRGGTKFCRTSWATVSRVTHRKCKVVVVDLVWSRTPTPTRPRRADRCIHLGAVVQALAVSILHTAATTAMATASQRLAMLPDCLMFELQVPQNSGFGSGSFGSWILDLLDLSVPISFARHSQLAP